MATQLTPQPQPSPTSAPAARAAPAWAVWLCPAATALVLYLCYFPVSAGALAWVAMVPLFALVRLPGKPKRLYLSCWLAAMAFHWSVLQWVRVADPMMYFAWMIGATYAACYWPVALAVLRWLGRRTALPLVVTAPAVWVSLEYVRYGMVGCFVSLVSGSHQHDVPGGFGWYLLGHTQHDFFEVIQIADLAGAFGVTALVAMANALLVEALAGREWFRRAFRLDEQRVGKTALLLQASVVGTILLLSLAYGVWRMRQTLDRDGPRIALIQTNVEQSRRNDASAPDEERHADARRSVADEFATLVGFAHQQKPDLIVTPETSYPGSWREDSPGVPTNGSQKLADAISGHVKTPILLGMSADVREAHDNIRSYNSSVLIGADGRWLGRYDKIHRVPFGEYVPLKGAVPFLKHLAPYDYDYEVAPGRHFTQFSLSTAKGTHVFGVAICYEDTDPAICRPYGGGGRAQANFLLNVSNDGWFKGSSEHDQHLAICRFRAVECRRSVGRAVNVGISALIDPNGRVLTPTLIGHSQDVHTWEIEPGAASLPPSRWREFKQAGGVIVGRVPIDARQSFYARHGDVFAIACLGFVTLWCVGLWVFRRSPTAT